MRLRNILAASVVLVILVADGIGYWVWHAQAASAGGSTANTVRIIYPADKLTVQAGPGHAGLPVAAPPRTLLLTQGELRSGQHYGYLGRELVRQAILEMARDDLGLDSRDQALGETATAEGTCGLSLQFQPGNHLHLQLEEQQGHRPLVTADLGFAAAGTDVASRVDNYLSLISALTESGPFEDALAQALGVPKRIVPTQAPSWPDGLNVQLAAMSVFSQVAALRRLHALAGSCGHQPRIDGALARGYANASLLTRQLWSDASAVFAARALLYAERTVRETGSSAWGLRQRAYARMLVGWIDLGSADLDRADQLAQSAEPDPEPWVPVLRHLAGFDHAALSEDDGAGPCAQLALVLDMVAVNHAWDFTLIYGVGARALQAAPTCLLATDLLWQAGGVGIGHQLSDYMPRALAAILANELGRCPGLPTELGSRLADGDTTLQPREVIRALRQADRTSCGAPSWAVFGQLLADEYLLTAYRQLDFMVDEWGVPADDGIAEYEDAIEDHPYRNLVLGFAVDPRQNAERLKVLLGQVRFRDFRIGMHEALARMNLVDHAHTCQIWDPCMHLYDPTAWDLAALADVSPPPLGRCADQLASVARHSPLIAVLRIRDEQVPCDDAALARYRHDFAACPSVRSGLAKRLMNVKRWQEAAIDLKAVIAVAPDKDAYQRLASCRYASGDEQGWVSTLQEYLRSDLPDPGLEHADVQNQLAGYFEGRGELATAWTYAQDAAGTGAGWAFTTAARIAEERSDLSAAEALWRSDAERYPDEQYIWYAFTIRTGQGAVDAARPLAAQQLAAMSASVGADDLDTAGGIAEELGDHRTARALLDKGLVLAANPWTGLFAALLAWEAGDLAAARAAAQRVAQPEPGKTGNERLPLRALAGDLDRLLAQGEHPQPDLPALQQRLAGCPVDDADDINLAYFIGRLLEDAGHASDAVAFYRHAVATRVIQKTTHVLACARLRALGVDPWSVHLAAVPGALSAPVTPALPQSPAARPATAPAGAEVPMM